MSTLSPNNKDTILAAIYNYKDRENCVNQRAILIKLFGKDFNTVISKNVGMLQKEGLILKKRINNNIIITLTSKGIKKAKDICILYGDIFNQHGKDELESILKLKKGIKKETTQERPVASTHLLNELNKESIISRISNSLDISIREAMKEELNQYIKGNVIDDLSDDIINRVIDTLYEVFNSIS